MGAPRPKTKYRTKYVDEGYYESHQDAKVKRGSTGQIMWGEELEDVTWRKGYIGRELARRARLEILSANFFLLMMGLRASIIIGGLFDSKLLIFISTNIPLFDYFACIDHHFDSL